MMPKRHVLLIDEAESTSSSLARVLKNEGFSVRTAAHAEEAAACVDREAFDYILCEAELPGRSGLELLPELVAEQPQATIVMMSVNPTLEQAQDSFRLGAYDWIAKPLRPQEFQSLIHKAEERMRLRTENRRLRRLLRDEGRGQGLVTSSTGMKRVLELVDQAARFKTSVLITGESGVGKEFIARTIHEWSDRSSMPFIAINCGSIPEALLETELFGHARGGLGGPDCAPRGLFQEAAGGTLFLDEIAQLSFAMQSKLLVTLQEAEVYPLGEPQSTSVDVRILAATARDLENEIRAERFSRNLYTRLDVLRIDIPALRERPEDLPDLAEHFLRRLSRQLGKKFRSLDSRALEVLAGYDWPGNIRELENLLERAAILSAGGRLVFDGLLPDMADFGLVAESTSREASAASLDPRDLSIERAVRGLEQELIRRALDASNGDVSRSAELLEISPETLREKLRAYQISGTKSLNEALR